MQARRWRFVAVAGAVSAIGAIAFYSADGAAAGRIWEMTIAVLLAMMLAGIVLFQGDRRGPWLAIWVGLLLAFVGGFLIAHPELSPFAVESPSFVDALRLANYPLGALGVMLLLFRSDRRIGWRALLEAAVVVGAGSVVIWLLVLEPTSAQSELTGGAFVVAVLYPVMDVLLFGVLVVATMHLDRTPGPVWLLVIALAGNLAADVAFGAQNLRGEYTAGGMVDLGWLLCFAALAVAPSWPIESASSVAPDDGRIGPGRLTLLCLGALFVPTIAAAEILGTGEPQPVVAVSSFVLVVLALVRMTVFNRDLDERRAEAASLAEELSESNVALSKARADQRSLLDRVHRLVERERIRIAADIHDRPLQNLVGVGYQLERVTALARRGEAEAAADLADCAADELARQLAELRDLMTDIRPPVLDEQGLIGALHDQGRAIEAQCAGLSVFIEGRCDRLGHDVETTLYRVSQEALTNVVQHARATMVVVGVAMTGDAVEVDIRDDGCGFDTSSTDSLVRSGHFGLAGMTERVELIGGAMDVHSSDRGTSLRFTVPIHTDSTGRSLQSVGVLQ